MSIAINHEINESEVLSDMERDTLAAIATTNAWEGGDGVIYARTLLGVEVDDQENNLRISNNSPNSDFNYIYPNPVSDVLYFNTPFISAEITDLTGRVLIDDILPGASLNVSSLASGLYLFNVVSLNNCRLQNRFVKR